MTISNNSQRASIDNATQLIPVSQWKEYHPWPPEGGLRHLIFHEKTNGFSAVIRRVGRRVLIDEAAFFEWVKENDKNANS